MHQHAGAPRIKVAAAGERQDDAWGFGGGGGTAWGGGQRPAEARPPAGSSARPGPPPRAGGTHPAGKWRSPPCRRAGAGPRRTPGLAARSHSPGWTAPQGTSCEVHGAGAGGRGPVGVHGGRAADASANAGCWQGLGLGLARGLAAWKTQRAPPGGSKQRERPCARALTQCAPSSPLRPSPPTSGCPKA
jgi:hypothetical protein